MPEIFTIPANSRVPVGFPARYLFIENISVPGAEIEIEGYGDLGGERFSFAETLTEGASLSGFPITINDWYFKNTSGVDLTVTIKAGLVYYQKNEFSGVVSGDVNALTTKDNKTLDGNQFIAAYNAGAASGQVSAVALLNPAASGVNAVVHKSLFECSPVISIGYMPEASFAGWNTLKSILAISSASQNYNKNGNASVSECDLVFTSNAIGMEQFMNTPASSFAPRELFSESTPFVIKPGYGLVGFGGVNVFIRAQHEWAEEII